MGNNTVQTQVRYFPIPRTMNFEWIEEMNEFVRTETERGYKVDYQTFIQNIILPNLRKLKIDCELEEFNLYNEYYFALQIFASADGEICEEIAIGWARAYHFRPTN
jgi:hypothetical protein